MARRPRVMTADDVIHKLDVDDYFLDELYDHEESVMLGSDNEFSDLKDIDEDDQEGNNYIHTNNKVISAFIMYQYSYIFSCFFSKRIPYTYISCNYISH